MGFCPFLYEFSREFKERVMKFKGQQISVIQPPKLSLRAMNALNTRKAVFSPLMSAICVNLLINNCWN